MKETDINALYCSLVTRFLDSLENGFARHHDIIKNTHLKKKIPFTPPSIHVENVRPDSLVETLYPDRESLENTIKNCTKCPLHTTRKNVVIGDGVPNPLVLIIGEGPGYYEDLQGIPFVGKSGQYLDKWLNAINLDRKKNCYISNIIKCRPPENRDPSNEEIAQCMDYLHHQINLLNPYIILACGRIAAQVLCQRQAALISLRQEIHYYNAFPLIVTYHPAAVLRNPDLRRLVWNDLKFLKKQMDRMGLKIP